MNRFPVLAAIAALLATPLQAQVLTGPATVIDGDTIDMTGTRIRLLGIDAPESGQSCTRDGQAWACGAEATATLREIIASAPITCTALGTDVYGRTLATCETAVFDVGQEMVRRGLALALDNAPDEYNAASAIAQQLHYGLWAATFQTPADWRAANPAAVQRIAQAETTTAGAQERRTRPAAERRYTSALGCAIKGNHSRYGDYIYHLPGQRYYQQTRPEALFCTESEAQAAGFRRSKE